MNMKNFDAKTYWEERLEKEYSLRGVGDIGLTLTYNKYLYKVRSAAFDRSYKSMGLSPAARVFDVGSGTGFYIGKWLEFCRFVSGSDLTETAVHKLRNLYPSMNFIQLDIGKELPAELAEQQYDAISAIDMLFHIVDDAAYKCAISNFSKLLKPGGMLLFSDNLLPFDEKRIEHQVSRSEKFVTESLEAEGFEFIGCNPMFVMMNDPVRSNSRTLRKLFAIIYNLARRGKGISSIAGMVLYPLERLLISKLSRGPSTEFFIWKKRS